jgi:hypothetical protein
MTTMIQCYNCNEWKPGEIAPFAICDDCKKPKTKQQTLYTFGYLSSRGERIFKELIAVRTPIIDEALNSGFSEPHIKLHSPEVGLEKLQAILDEYKRAAIFCACSSKLTCHRIDVANLAKQRIAGLQVIHL